MSTSNSQVRIKTEEKEDPLIMLMEPGVAMTVKTTDGSQDEKRLLVIDERDDEVEDSDTNQTKCVAKVRRDEVSDSAS